MAPLQKIIRILEHSENRLCHTQKLLKEERVGGVATSGTKAKLGSSNNLRFLTSLEPITYNSTYYKYLDTSCLKSICKNSMLGALELIKAN